jgi:serine/threonine protein kinase
MQDSKHPKVIGEGAYGCVTKPSLECTDGYDVRGKVSKIMNEPDAQDEMEHLMELYSIKGIEKFVVPKPHLCTPVEGTILNHMINNCVNKRLKHVFSNIQIIVSEDGGVTLDVLLKEWLPYMTSSDICTFVLQWMTLFDFLCFFHKNELMHHDIKMQNVLYNIKKKKLYIIDFGKLIHFNDYIKSAKENQNREGISWSNYPTETPCINVDAFYQDTNCTIYKNQYTHDDFLYAVASTFDMYSTGLMLLKVVELFRTNMTGKNTISHLFFEECIHLFSQMSNPELLYRPIHPCNFKKKYAALLKKYKIRETQQYKNGKVRLIKRRTKKRKKKLVRYTSTRSNSKSSSNSNK